MKNILHLPKNFLKPINSKQVTRIYQSNQILLLSVYTHKNKIQHSKPKKKKKKEQIPTNSPSTTMTQQKKTKQKLIFHDDPPFIATKNHNNSHESSKPTKNSAPPFGMAKYAQPAST